MENFNIFKECLEKAPVYGKRDRFKLLAKRGDEHSMAEVWGSLISETKTNGEILLYDSLTESLDWKALYKSNKGFYFNKNGRNYIH